MPHTSGGTYPGWGSITEDVPGVAYGIYGAVDSTTGKIVWKIQVPQALSGMTVAGGDAVRRLILHDATPGFERYRP